MSTRTNPMEELERLFERWSGRFGDSTDDWDGGFGWKAFESMAVDFVEHDDTFVVTADLPGFERDDVEVTVTDHTLRIEAERQTTDREEDEEGRYLRQERRHRAVDRSIRLPEEVDTDAATGTMRHGVLTVTLPKLVVEEAHQVEIE